MRHHGRWHENFEGINFNLTTLIEDYPWVAWVLLLTAILFIYFPWQIERLGAIPLSALSAWHKFPESY